MRFGIKYVSIAVVATAVLATAGCGGSGSSSSGGSGATLSTDQVSSLLLTDKDEPGWLFDASNDGKSTNDSPETLTAGGSACQAFVDAENALVTKYETTVDVLRTFLQSSGSDTLLDNVAVLPSSAKAAAVMSDLATGLKDCQSFTETGGSGTSATKVTASANSPVSGSGHVDYTAYLSGGTDVVQITDVTQVGKEVMSISYVGRATHDTAALQQMVATVSHASQVQASRFKAATG